MSGALVGLFVPGESVVHRTRPGVKLATLAVGLTLVTLAGSVPAVLAGLAVVAAVGALARLGGRVVLAPVRSLVWVLGALGTVQLWLSGWRTAVVVCGSILVAVLAANLVTLTTRTQDLLDALVAALGPLRRFGIHPERVGLLMSLVIRTVPVLARIAGEVREARIARGAQRSARALAVPMVIRTVRHADRLGEALVARGADD